MAQAKKTTKSTVKPTAKVAAKVTKTPPKSEAKPKSKFVGTDVEEAVTEMMEEIDGHEMASSEVTQKKSIEYYKGIIQGCRAHIDEIEEDMDREDITPDDSDGDGVVGEDDEDE